MQSITLHNLPDALRAVIEAQARLHQCSVEEEIRQLLEQATGPLEQAATVAPPSPKGEQEVGQKCNVLADLFEAIPPEYRLTREESEFLSNLRYNTSPNPQWPSDTLHAVIAVQARLHQCSVEEEIRQLLKRAIGQQTEEQGEVPKYKTLTDLCNAIPPECRLTREESEFLSNLRNNTSPDLRWPE